MGKRRSAAKTGDKKLYASRRNAEHESLSSSARPSSVDDFHQQRDESFLALESKDKMEEPADDAFETKQHILDLGVDDDSSGDEDEDSADDDDDDQEVDSSEMEDDTKKSSKKKGMPTGSASSADDDDDDDSSDGEDPMEELAEVDPRNWGRRKSAYYSADTGDLEIGQDEDDAFVEEAAAREVQSSRFGEMDQDDFEISDDDVETAPLQQKSTKFATTRDISKLGPKDRRKLLKLQHPEMIPIVSHFSDVSKEFMDSTRVATKVLLENNLAAESVGATEKGRIFLLTKSMLEQSVSLNTALYLLVKSAMAEEGEEGDDSQVIDSHPIMLQLKRVNATMDKFGDRVVSKTDNVKEQVRNLVNASRLMQSSEGMLDEDDEDESVPVEERMDDNDIEADSEEGEEVAKISKPARQIKEERPRLEVLDEARFGLRHHEIDLVESKTRRYKTTDLSDFGDAGGNGESSRALAATINAIDQRAARKPKKGREEQRAMQTDYDDEGGHEMADGLKMMEAQLGAENDIDDSQEFAEEEGDDNMRMTKEDSRGMQFYNAMAASAERKKQIKKDMHRVAPKFPTSETEITGERAISKTILKNRGLVPHKAKINRNPRVKKREQYRKAVIKRKGAVREVRTNEGHKYEGEDTGIKSRITRSRKLVS